MNLFNSTCISRTLIRAVALATALTSSTYCQAQVPDKPARPVEIDPTAGPLVEAHNKERAKEGLPPLKLEGRLTEAAKVHARDMAEHQKMTHEGSNGSTPAQRVVAAGYHYQRTGENVAVGYFNVAEVMRGWMDSPPHKKNLLGEFTEIGVARIIGEDGKAYWCADFGTPMPRFDPATASSDLIKRINDLRVAAKLPEMTLDPRLAKAAQEQAASLALKKSQGGETSSFEGIDQKLYSELALSTANGHPDSQTMAQVLMDQADLKAQILGKFTKIGTGYALAEDGTPYWCLILGIPARR